MECVTSLGYNMTFRKNGILCCDVVENKDTTISFLSNAICFLLSMRVEFINFAKLDPLNLGIHILYTYSSIQIALNIVWNFIMFRYQKFLL